MSGASAAPAATKITIIGDAHAGKSSIVRRIVFSDFNNNQESTVGAAFASKTYRGKKYHIWDTAGQERYAKLVPLYLSGASIILLVYDVTCIYSFERISEYWLPYIRENLRMKNEEQPMLVLIGNKIDIAHSRIVTEAQGKELAEQHGMGFVEVSARTGDNSQSIMETVANFVDRLVQNQASIKRQSSALNLDALALAAPTDSRCFGYC